jgi:hypothetical protein
LKIKFPEGAVSRISRIRFVAANALMPSINFENCGYLGTKGFMHLGLGTDSNTVNYDATNIRGARGIIFEITRPNLPFESPNSTRPSTVLMKEIHAPGASGIIQIKRELFPTPGIYQGRAWAVDSSGARIGVAGDHMIFAIDS